MANQIIVQIIGDDAPIKETQKNIQIESRKTGESIQQNLGDVANKSVSSVNATFVQLNQSINDANTGLENLARSLQADIATAFVGFSALFGGNINKSFFGAIEGLTALSAAFIGLGLTLRGFESETARAFGTVSLLVGVLIGGLTAAVAFAVVKLGELAFFVGSQLVESFQKASDIFVKADRQLLVFTSTVENYNNLTKGVTGTTSSWTGEVERLASTFNVSRIELQKSAAEIISVGSKIDLAEEQLQKLLQVSVEYAKVNGKDLFDTTVAFASALNGQSQSVLQYGVKLSEASNQSFIFKSGLEDNFSALSDNEKAQVRYNNLLKQYAGIAGIAASVSESLSDQDEKLAVNLEKVNIQLGKGAALIENNNILTAAYNKALGLLSDTTLNYLGFLGALGARLLQVGGLFLSFALKIFVAISAFKILNALLASSVTQTAFAVTLPLLNRSFNDLITQLAGTTVQINSVKSALIALGLIAKNTVLTFGGLFAAPTQQALTFGQSLALVGQRIITVFNLIRTTLIAALAPLAPFIIKIAALVAVVSLFKNALEAIEQRTKVFSELFTLLKDRLNEAGPVIQAIAGFFGNIRASITDLVDRGFGLFVSGLSFVIQKILELAANIPFAEKILGENFVNGINGATIKLASLREELSLVGFSFSSLGQTVLASGKDVDKGVSVNLDALNKLKQDLADVGKTDLQKLNEERTQRIDLLTRALQQELLTEAQFKELMLKTDQDFALRRKELLKNTLQGTKEFLAEGNTAFDSIFSGLEKKILDLQATSLTAFESIGATAIDTLGKGIGSGFAAFGKALVKGENALEAFGKAFLGVIGQAAVAVGTELILRGIAYSFDPFLAGFAPGLIAGGAALAAFGGALSALSGGEGGGATSGLTNPFAGDIGNTDGAELEAKPTTSIAININGDVLDSDETPSRIVDLLKKELDRSGNSILQVG